MTVQGSNKSSSRNDYITSGLYTTFTLTSLQSGTQLFKSIKMENPGRKLSEKKASLDPAQSVIKFGTIPPKLSQLVLLETVPQAAPQNKMHPPQQQSPPKTLPSQQPAPLEAPPQVEELVLKNTLAPQSLGTQQQQKEGEAPPAVTTVPGICLSGPGSAPSHSDQSPSHSAVPDSSQELIIDSDIESISSQPCELQPQQPQVPQSSSLQEVKSGEREAETSSDQSSQGSCHNGKSKKPKGLELTPPLVVTSPDFSTMNLGSPSLTSLTPAFLQTPTLLLTPSPLLSNIHFWSTLSPVAPLSPAWRQGTPTLFQFPSVMNTQFQLPVHSVDGSNTPAPLSPDSQKT
ncbi:hypothetical protein AGOR_G00133670 [Albula goreensis]|uniref:Uncharacterized protein n=1 Tax=Albula goreensis TaxID=1534307 RepID=A0A8T3DC53_9TELE|nr:hypothetical protein AGOR_G00133670 [Albula goreensis]